jgi:hypothetical protein
VIYLDGSALCRFLPGVRHYAAFGAWAGDHIDELVTTQLGFTELRQAAELYPRSAAERIAGIVDMVRAGVGVIRFSDDNVTISSHATTVLKPFAALHLGAAVAHEKVHTIVTYDPALAHVARIYKLGVISPGLAEGWFLDYQGPPEHWKPVALDAPYDPDADFVIPEPTPRLDAYEEALRAARAQARPTPTEEEAARATTDAGDDGDATTDADTTTTDADATTTDGDTTTTDGDTTTTDGDTTTTDGDTTTTDADTTTTDADTTTTDADTTTTDADTTTTDADATTEPGAGAADDVESEVDSHSELERALREAEAEAAASEQQEASDDGVEGDLDVDGSDVDNGLPMSPSVGTLVHSESDLDAQSPGDGTGRIGTYRPRIQAWHEGDDGGTDPALEPASEEPPVVGTGLPWTNAPAPVDTPTPPAAVVPGAPPPLQEGTEDVPAGAPMPEATPELAPPAPIEPVSVPNLPREERGVPPVIVPSREVIGSPARRPMFDTEPHPDSRASRPPDPVPSVPPEESSPLTVPIKWNVELDEPEAYLPLRFDSENSRALPSLPVSFAGGQGGLTIQSPGTVAVPALEPTAPPLAQGGTPDTRSLSESPVAPASVSSKERKAEEKAAKKVRERQEKLLRDERSRQEKLAKKDKGSAPSAPVPPATGASEGWKLDDVLNLGPKKRGS